MTMASPSDPKEAAELARLVTSMDGAYGRGKYARKARGVRRRVSISKRSPRYSPGIETRPPARMWRAGTRSPRHSRRTTCGSSRSPTRARRNSGSRYRCHVEVAIRHAARKLREGTRSPVGAAAAVVSLVAHLRPREAAREYGDAVPADGPIPAHLLGNIWAQDWSNVYDIVAPPGGGRGISLDNILKARNVKPERDGSHRRALLHVGGIRSAAEDVLGASLFVKPRDREVAVTRAPGTSTTWTTSASRCASIRRRKTSRPFITSSGMTSTRVNTTTRSR